MNFTRLKDGDYMLDYDGETLVVHAGTLIHDFITRLDDALSGEGMDIHEMI